MTAVGFGRVQMDDYACHIIFWMMSNISSFFSSLGLWLDLAINLSEQ